jgi:hypothetical protein
MVDSSIDNLAGVAAEASVAVVETHASESLKLRRSLSSEYFAGNLPVKVG